MRSIFLTCLAIVALFQGTVFAQVGMNSISIATTSDGSVIWNASIDGHNRKGYHDKQMSGEVCNHSKVDKDVLEPVTSDLYPNPSTDMLFFTGTGYDNFTVTIKDAGGKTMATQKYFDHASMDISWLNDGMYIVEIVAEKTGEVSTKKLIKE